MTRNKKVTMTESDLQSMILHPVSAEGKESKKQSFSERSVPWDLLPAAIAGSSGIS